MTGFQLTCLQEVSLNIADFFFPKKPISRQEAAAFRQRWPKENSFLTLQLLQLHICNISMQKAWFLIWHFNEALKFIRPQHSALICNWVQIEW